MSIYAMRKDNLIFQDADRHNVNGAQTRNYGAELSLDYSVMDNWTLLAVDATLARHTYSESHWSSGRGR